MNQAELLRYVAETLEALDIPYMVTGSQASVYYGEPRFTQDIDIVADLTTAHIAAFMARFPSPEFAVSEFAVREAIETCGQFNVIHPGSGLKIDIVIRKDTACHRAEFERRQRQPILPGAQAWFARPEDVIISKMLSVKGGPSGSIWGRSGRPSGDGSPGAERVETRAGDRVRGPEGDRR